jgi:hypothetical protein
MKTLSRHMHGGGGGGGHNDHNNKNNTLQIFRD